MPNCQGFRTEEPNARPDSGSFRQRGFIKDNTGSLVVGQAWVEDEGLVQRSRQSRSRRQTWVGARQTETVAGEGTWTTDKGRQAGRTQT